MGRTIENILPDTVSGSRWTVLISRSDCRDPSCRPVPGDAFGIVQLVLTAPVTVLFDELALWPVRPGCGRTGRGGDGYRRDRAAWGRARRSPGPGPGPCGPKSHRPGRSDRARR
jgi:hypothetical protein